MLRSFRDNIKGRFGKIVLALIIIPFIGFGAADLIMNSGGGAKVLEVNGNPVDELAMAQEMQFTRNTLIRQMGENIRYEELSEERLAPIAKERVIQRLLMEEQGEYLKLGVPESLVEQYIVNTPAFKVDGKFSSEHMNLVLADSGFNLSAFKEKLAEDKRAAQFQLGLQASGFASKKDIELMLQMGNESRSIEWVQIKRADLSEDIQVSNEELQVYYEGNREQFNTEFAVDVEYILLDAKEFRPEISEEALQQEYARLQSQYEVIETRQVSHILFEINNDQPRHIALDKLEAIKLRAEQGEDFSALAQEFSQDSGSASDGGDLGYTERDGSYPEAFEDALFALEKNAISDPVETDAGIHLIRVGDIALSEMPSLEEQRLDIINHMQESESTKQFVEISEELADRVFNADGLASSAQVLDLELKKIAQLTRQGESLSVKDTPPLIRDQRVLQAVFSNEILDEGLNSELIELDATRSLVVRVAKAHQPRLLSLEEAKDSLRASVLSEKLEALLDIHVEEITAAVGEGTELTTIATQRGLALQNDEKVSRRSTGFDAAVLEAVFSVARSQAGSSIHRVADAQGNIVLFQLKNIDTGDESATGEFEKLLSQQAQSLYSQQEVSAYWQSIRQHAEIVESE